MVGQNIGKYRVLDRIGRGGMGTVYRAIDETLHREVAIKVLNAELNDPEVARRFRAEAITVARLSHPGIATIYELFQHEGQWLMVMEFVRGETLEHMVDRMGALSPQRSAELCMQALAALAHAHSMGVVHRDLKPANLMITETGAIKIMDFGIARVAGTEHLTNAGFMMGTPAYMSPEQVRGAEIDARADLYAMGVVFYRLTTGKLPFKGDTPFAMAQSQVNDPPTPVSLFRSDLPPWVEQVVVRALQKGPEQRFQSAVEFHEAFARCLAGLPLSTMYGSSAPTELIATPSRPLPTLTGPMPTTPPMPSAYSGAMPRLPTPTGVSPAPTVTTPAAAAATQATPAAPAAAPPATAPAAIKPPAAGTIAPVKRNNATLIAAAVGFVIVAGIVWALWLRPRPPQEPPPPTPPVDPAPAATTTLPPGPDTPPPSASTGAPPPPPPPPVTEPPPAGTTPPPATGSTTVGPTAPAGTAPAGAGTTTASGVPPATTGRAGDPAAGGTTPAGGRGPAVDDSAAMFTNIKLLIISGRRTTDQDVTLNFGGGQLTVVPKNGGAPISSLPYRRILRATYIRDDNPRWDPALPGPEEKIDAGGFLGRDRHWLTLQAKDSYTIVRLEGDAWLNVLQTFEARTGIKIDRPSRDAK